MVVSWPPGAMSLAIHPSKRIGFSSARAAYTAAVWAAGPLPMMQSLVLTVGRMVVSVMAAEDAAEVTEAR